MQRQTLTRESLKGALVYLLQHKNFESITISDLCRTAGINRTTFYLHYIDKYDFVYQLKEEQVQRFLDILQQYKNNAIEALRQVLLTIDEDGPFFRVISQASFANFAETLHDVIMTIVKQDAHAEYFIQQYYQNIPSKYANELFLSSIEGVITFWITNDYPESPEEILDILLKIPAFQWWTQEES